MVQSQFNGVYPAPVLTPSPCGILSVADVWTHTRTGYDERWIRGFSQEFDSNPTVKLRSGVGYTVTNGTLSTHGSTPRFQDIDSFYIEVEDDVSGMDLPADDTFGRALRELEAVTQKAVEREFWDGLVATSEATTGPGGQPNTTNFLTKQTPGATIPSATAATPLKALALLEQAIAGNPTGSNGVIHMTPDVAINLPTNTLIWGIDPVLGLPQLQTILGTAVAVGSGYSGNGPIGNAQAAASITNKWMFATGSLMIHLGQGELMNEDLSRGFNPATNDMTTKASRPAAVVFDSSIWAAQQVTLP